MRKTGLIVVVLALGCGDDGSGDATGGTDGGTAGETETTAGTEGTGSGGSATSTSGGSSGGSGGSGGSASSGATDSATGTGGSGGSGGSGGTGTTGGTGSSTGSGTGAETSGGTTGGVEDADYHAFALIGALDRVVVRKANNDTGQCTELRLVNPGPAGGDYAVTIPATWGVESASLTDALTGCLASEPLAGTPDWGTGGSGTVDWDMLGPNQYYPCSIDVDVTVMFEQTQPWSRPSESLTVQDLAVKGCM